MDYVYIEENGIIYVPRPTSICMGQKRHVDIKNTLGVEPLIVSPKVWEFLESKHTVQTITCN